MLLTIEVMYVAVQRSKDALVALSFFILLVLVFFATLIYFAERGSWDANLGGFVDADGDPSMFDSIPQTAWFALVTMSTVGYGDVVPRSFLGKLLTMPLLMFGLLLIALPSFVLGRNFAIVFDAMNNQALIAVRPHILCANQADPKPSPNGTPRSSLERERERPQSPDQQPYPNTSAPLLPTTSTETSSYPPARANGPALPSGGAKAQPRMWDGALDGPVDNKTSKDLTNIKLAKNQLVRHSCQEKDRRVGTNQ